MYFLNIDNNNFIRKSEIEAFGIREVIRAKIEFCEVYLTFLLKSGNSKDIVVDSRRMQII